MLKASGHQHIRTILLHKLQHPSQEELLKYSNYLNVFQQFFYVYHQTGIEGFIPWFSSFHVRPLSIKPNFFMVCTEHRSDMERSKSGSYTLPNLSPFRLEFQVEYQTEVGIPTWIQIQIGIPSWVVDPLGECMYVWGEIHRWALQCSCYVLLWSMI